MEVHSPYFACLKRIKNAAVNGGRNLEAIRLVAVSKGQPIQSLKELYEEGCCTFGESRVSEALEKIENMPRDCEWHFIGTLQSNKVTKVVSRFKLIHSVDSLALAAKINQVSQDKGVTSFILLQVNVTGELSKHGLKAFEWENVLDQLHSFEHIRVRGLMTMARAGDSESQIRACFHELRELRNKWKERMKYPDEFLELSMGMSNDFEIAVEEGATLVRVGSILFRDRAH